MSLRVTFAGSRPPISMATGTTHYDGGPPVPAGALWQIGSNTKAFTAVIVLQLEAEGKLSISDTIGTGCRSTRPGPTSRSASYST